MDFRRKAIELYNNGMSAEKISKKININVTENTILGWINEEKQYEEQKIKRKKEKQIAKIAKEIKKAKQIMKDTYDLDQKDQLCNFIIDKVKQILEIDPNNEIAIVEKITTYMKLDQLENAENTSRELLKINPNNIIALNYLSKIEQGKGNLEQEKQYLERILQIRSEDEEPQIVMRLGRVNRLIEERERKKEQSAIKSDMELNEEKQQEYAKQNISVEELFTIETQNEYIDNIYKDFVEGKINKSQLKNIYETLKKYPDKVKSAIVIADLYSKLTDKNEGAIQILAQLENDDNLTGQEKQILKEEIHKYNSIIYYSEQQAKNEQDERDKQKEKLKEQREYSKKILDRMKKGKITKEELAEIVKKLENYPDKAKSIFLITKLYEIVEGREEALNILLKYTKLCNLSYNEKKMIIDMQTAISNRRKMDNSTTERIKRKYDKRNEKQQRKERKYKKQMQKETVIKYIEEGKTIDQIKILLQSKGTLMSITNIRKIRDYHYKNDPNMSEKIERIKNTAVEFLDAGYEASEVYKLIGCEISLKEIKQLEKENDNELSH